MPFGTEAQRKQGILPLNAHEATRGAPLGEMTPSEVRVGIGVDPKLVYITSRNIGDQPMVVRMVHVGHKAVKLLITMGIPPGNAAGQVIDGTRKIRP